MELREVIRRGPMTRFQWTVVVMAILLTVIDGYEILVTSFTLPALTEYWKLGTGEQGLVASIGTLGMGVGAAALSPIGDRLGRRKHILISLVAIVIGMVLSGLAPSFSLFLVFRFLAGLFLGGIVPSINVLVSEYASDEKRGTVMGIYGIGFPLGAALGGFLSIFLIGQFGWRGPFFFSAVVTALLGLWAVVALPESVGYLVERRPAGALETYNRLGAKLGLPAVERLPQAASATIKPSMAKDMWQGVMLKRTVLLWISYALLIAAFYFSNSLTATLVKESTGNANIGIVAQALVATGGVLGALTFAALSTRLHPRLVTAFVMFFGTVIFFLFAYFFKVTSIVLVLAVLVGVAANGGVAAYYAISPPIYPTNIRAAAVGQMMGFGRIVAFLAPNIATFLKGQGLSSPAIYQIFGVVLAVSGVTVWLLHRSYSGDNSLDAMQTESAAVQQVESRVAH